MLGCSSLPAASVAQVEDSFLHRVRFKLQPFADLGVCQRWIVTENEPAQRLEPLTLSRVLEPLFQLAYRLLMNSHGKTAVQEFVRIGHSA